MTHRAICTPEATIPRMASFLGHNSNPVHSLQGVNKIVSMGRTSGKKSTSDTQPAAQLATIFIPKYLEEQKTQRKWSFETINA